MAYYQWAPYVPVAQRRKNTAKKMDKLRKAGKNIQPINIKGNKISRSFWGMAWCEHLEAFSDYKNRLPRGRTYARNGSVCRLEVQKGEVYAMVSGSDIYHLKITIAPLIKSHWKRLQESCAGQISSMLDLLKGELSDGVMKVVTNPQTGMFPKAKEIELSCDCPDGAYMCKHVAAVLYGVGARLDHSPELLFLLRGVDHNELVYADIALPKQTTNSSRRVSGDLSDVFGIELDGDMPEPIRPTRRPSGAKASPKKKAAAKKPVVVKKAPAKKKAAITPIAKKKAPLKKQVAGKKRAFSITAKGFARMRKKFAMNMSQFARLVGISPVTVKRWELKDGKLNLPPEHLKTLESLASLDRAEVWETLGETQS